MSENVSDAIANIGYTISGTQLMTLNLKATFPKKKV